MDIALHSVMIKNIPDSVSVPAATERVKEIFEKLFTEEKVISVRVLPKLDDLYEKA